jgi:hypothetical protein
LCSLAAQSGEKGGGKAEENEGFIGKEWSSELITVMVEIKARLKATVLRCPPARGRRRLTWPN